MPTYGDPREKIAAAGPRRMPDAPETEPPGYDVERPSEPAPTYEDVERPSYRDDVDHPGAYNDRDDLGIGGGPENIGVGTPTNEARGHIDERDDLGMGRGVPVPVGDERAREAASVRRGIVIAPAEPGSPGHDVVTVGPEQTPLGEEVGARTGPVIAGDELSERLGVEGPFAGEELGQETRRRELDRLDEYLRGELSAVETYDLAIARCKSRELEHKLRDLCQSHQRRVNLLRERIRALGGRPADGSGPWGTLAKLVQRGADLLGMKVALDTLEEGEEHGVQMYEEDMDDADARTIELVRSYLLPEQRETRKMCHALKKAA